MNRLPKDRRNRQIEEGDYVAFDYMVCMADDENSEMWDILWGVAKHHGIEVLIDPLTGRENLVSCLTPLAFNCDAIS